MVVKQVVELNTGAEMPVLGFGTWQSSPDDVTNAVKIALEAGYRHIDTATGYGNEKEVGEGIKQSGVPREEIFLTTKLNTPDMKDPEAALEYSLKQLDTPYLDLWLLHWSLKLEQALPRGTPGGCYRHPGGQPNRTSPFVSPNRARGVLLVEGYRRHGLFPAWVRW